MNDRREESPERGIDGIGRGYCRGVSPVAGVVLKPAAEDALNSIAGDGAQYGSEP